MKKIHYIFYILVLFIFSPSFLHSMTVFKNDSTSIDIFGNMNFAYMEDFNDNTLNYLSRNKDSHIGISLENQINDSLLTEIIFDLRINKIPSSWSINKDYLPLEINEFYFQLHSKDKFILKLGNFKSVIIQSNLPLQGDHFSLLDAGYSFINPDYHGNRSILRRSMTNVLHGIGYYSVKSKYRFSFEVETGENNFSNIYNNIEQLSNKYSLSIGLNYVGDFLSYGFGYKKIGNISSQNSDADNSTECNITNSSDNFLTSFSLSNEMVNFSFSGGYYKNQKLPQQDHIGMSTVISFALTKLNSYVGYQILYSTLERGVNISNLEQSFIITGLTFDIGDHSVLGLEYKKDIMSQDQISSSHLNGISSNVLLLFLNYSF